MIKIGFIDYYLDEWHANNYPALLKEASDGEMKVAYAYAMIDSPIGGMTTKEWCNKYKIPQCLTIEELIEKSDVIVVLSPDNCEMHEELCQLPLRSKKPVYVDKTFAPDKETAIRIFEIAQQSGTPCYSTSALRFAAEYQKIDPAGVQMLNSWGGGSFETYSIHQLEPIMMLMKAPAKRIMSNKGKKWLCMTIEFKDGRVATLSQMEDGAPFMMNVCSNKGNNVVNVQSDFFKAFIAELVKFFKTGVVPVPHEQTVEIMALREKGIQALQCPGVWVEL